MGSFVLMRKREDSSLRWDFSHTAFRVRSIQPLWHASIYKNLSFYPIKQKPSPKRGEGGAVHSEAPIGATACRLSFSGGARSGRPPGGVRTPDNRVRNPMLCPAELRAREEDWCRERDLNPHGKVSHRLLRPTRLPFRHPDTRGLVGGAGIEPA